jgi:hypothetical protein
MATYTSERGFTIVELMIASLLSMMVLGVAFTTFQNALQLNDAVLHVADANQNLRAGTNLLVRDLMQAGRAIPVGGIAIPAGEDSEAINRPSPAGDMFFDNEEEGARLMAITTGAAAGETVAGRPTDLITIVMADPFLEELELYQSDCDTGLPRIDTTGSSFSAGDATSWIEGDPENGVSPIKKGDLIFFTSTGSGNAIQTVTRVEDSVVYFDEDENDAFNLNQRGAETGSITQILPDVADSPCEEDSAASMIIRRVLMYTYYVEAEADGTPRLMRQLNHFDATALAGVIEDLTLRYDLVDGDENPTGVGDLPYEEGGDTYTANQIRKVNVHVGVRSETVSQRSGEYLRQHLSTVVSIRNLAFVSRYNTEEEES